MVLPPKPERISRQQLFMISWQPKWRACDHLLAPSFHPIGVRRAWLYVAPEGQPARSTTNEKGTLARREQLIAEPDLRCHPSGRVLFTLSHNHTLFDQALDG